MNTAEKFTYLDAEISKASRIPGVGEYNTNRQLSKKLGKWDKSSKNSKGQNSPSSADYTPNPIDINLFSNKKKVDKGEKFTTFTNEKRFKEKKVKKVPFYLKLCEWGMKSNYEKKDTLSKISKTPNTSIYYD